MECPCCSNPSRKFGFNRNKTQRFRCDCCRKTFTEEQHNPLGIMRLEMDKAVAVVRCLVKGCSVRSTQRMTNVAKHAIFALLVHVGSNCKQMIEDRLTDVAVNDIEGDEIWNFVGCKERTKVAKQLSETVGDSYTFIGIERTTKLIVAWHLGKRSHDGTVMLTHKLSHATSGHFQMTTDGFAPYKKVIPDMFGSRVDFSQLIKVYGKEGVEEQRRYSPPVVTKIDYQEISGSPKHERASTSFVERSNLSIRMGVRRFTRLTNGFSKKWKNHEAALALWVAFYNYARKHMTLKVMPAMASGLADHVWTIRKLIEESAKH